MAQKLGVKSHHEIIDYTHAKQNLQKVIGNLPESLGSKKLAEIIADWKDHLWNGEHDDILSQNHSLIESPAKRKEALKKFKNYFSAILIAFNTVPSGIWDCQPEVAA